MPFGNESLQLEKMRYLTVDQALADLEYFICWIKTTNMYSVTAKNPW